MVVWLVWFVSWFGWLVSWLGVCAPLKASCPVAVRIVATVSGQRNAQEFSPLLQWSSSISAGCFVDCSLELLKLAKEQCLCLCLFPGGRSTARRRLSLRSKSSSPQALPNQQQSLHLMICFFDWDPCVPGHLAQINSMPSREPCAHSSTSSAVSSGQLSPRRPCDVRQSDILMMLNIVYMELEMAILDDWDPGDNEQSAYSNSMPDLETRAHSSTSSTVSSGRLTPRRP